MPIFPLTYRHWDGERGGALEPLRAIIRAGVATGWRSHLRKAVIVFTIMPVVFYLGMAYFFSEYVFGADETVVNQFVNVLGKGTSDMLRTDGAARAELWALYLYGYLSRPTSTFSLFVVVVMGAGLIAADRRHNAMEIYFARPVRWSEYVLGKLGIIGFWLAVVMLAPALLLWLEIVLFSPHASDVWFLIDLVPRLVLVWVAWTVFAGLPMLAISSLSSSTGLAAFLWVALWLGSDAVSAVAHRIYAAFKWPPPPVVEGRFRPPHEWRIPSWAESLSLGDNLISLQYTFVGAGKATPRFLEAGWFGRQLETRVPGVEWWVSALILGTLAGISLLVLRWRVRPEGAA